MINTRTFKKRLMPDVEPKVVFGAKVKAIYDGYLQRGIKNKEVCRKFNMSPTQVRRMFKGEVTDENMVAIAEAVSVSLDELIEPDMRIIIKLIKDKMKSDGNFMLMIVMMLLCIICIVMSVLVGNSNYGLLGTGCACFAVANIRNIWRPLKLDENAKKAIRLSKYLGVLFVSFALISEVINNCQI